MITKKRLLSGLRELLHVEEEAVTLYANFSKAMLRQTEGIAREKREKINGLLSQLYQDSARHKKSIGALIENIMKGADNEY